VIPAETGLRKGIPMKIAAQDTILFAVCSIRLRSAFCNTIFSGLANESSVWLLWGVKADVL
jgi:hypothetical protein